MSARVDSQEPAILPFPPPPPAFEDLMAGRNGEALAAARAAAASPSPTAASVYVWGAPGRGKTMLLRAAVTAARDAGQQAFYASGESLPPPMPALLAADDVGALPEAGRLELFDWQNRIRPGSAYRIIAAAECPPSEAGLGDEIAARFAAGLVFRLHDIGEDDKRRALALYARRRGFDLPEQVIAFFLTRLPRDMTSLTEALSDFDRFMFVRRRAPTLPLARQWLEGRSPTLAEE